MLYEDELDQAIAISRAERALAEIKRKRKDYHETLVRVDHKTVRVIYTKKNSNDSKNSKTKKQ